MSLWKDLSPSDPRFAVQLVDRLIAAAIEKGVSDVHLHPRREHWEILFRIDGTLVPLGTVPRSEQTDPVARLMVMANLPSYRSGSPQEGSLSITDVDQPGGLGNIEMRLGTFPTVHGLRGVIRFVSGQHRLERLDDLSLPTDVTDSLRQLCDSREGVVLMVGPAGSGKTTTLYACLRHIADGPIRRSVLTIEDPIEAVIDSISQSQLSPASGMTLAAGLRSAVRQDPEVLLVSEIRDAETADAVLNASLSGHLCFSSLHAGDVATALHRLSQMELPLHLLHSGLLGVCTLRLLRRLCEVCSGKDLACENCLGTRYRGRVAIAQCVDMNDSVGEAIMDAVRQGKQATGIRNAGRDQGMLTLADQAHALIRSGRTDEREACRILGHGALVM